MKRLQIFRTGQHTSSDGRSVQFTEAELKAAAAAYDPKIHEAPFTIGHPEGTAPAYGWVGALSFSDPHLEADPTQIDDAFSDLIKKGRFKKVSASFYEPTSPENPKPGVYYLRHVAFLGAQPPAVKGLRSVEFSAAAKGIVEFTDWEAANLGRLMRGLRDWLINKFGQEEADKALPPWATDELLISAGNKTPAFSEPEHQEQDMTKEEIEQREAALKIREEKLQAGELAFSERDTSLKGAEAAARKRGHVDFADSLVKAGKLLPTHKDGVVALLCALPVDGTIEFGEGDKKQTPKTAAWLQEFLNAQPVHVDFKERGGAPAPAEAVTDPTAIAAKAVEFVESERAAGRIVNIAQAVEHVTAQQTQQ